MTTGALAVDRETDLGVRWIVDGMNVIGSVPDGWWRDRPAARRRLVAHLSTFGRRTDVEAVDVVFDGDEVPAEVDEGSSLGVGVSFAGRGANAADGVIAARVEAAREAGGITVVTSDVALVAAVRAAGGRVTGSSSFRRDLEGAGHHGTTPSSAPSASERP